MVQKTPNRGEKSLGVNLTKQSHREFFHGRGNQESRREITRSESDETKPPRVQPWSSNQGIDPRSQGLRSQNKPNGEAAWLREADEGERPQRNR